MRIGPNLAKVPLVKPFVNAFATKAPASVAVILDLPLMALFSNCCNAPLKLPLTAVSNTDAAFSVSINDKAVPASIADMLKLFLALRRGALRLGAMHPIL
jgi:hypothetical protein